MPTIGSDRFTMETQETQKTTSTSPTRSRFLVGCLVAGSLGITYLVVSDFTTKLAARLLKVDRRDVCARLYIGAIDHYKAGARLNLPLGRNQLIAYCSLYGNF